MISGILASPGIAYGKALLLQTETIVIKEKNIQQKNIETEIKKLFESKNISIQELKNIQKKSKKNFHQKELEIFDGHIMILEDIELEKEIITLIQNKHYTAAYAIEKSITNQIQKIKKINNTYMQNRAIDIRDIGNRWLKNILHVKKTELKNINEQIILVANDLTPSETAQMNFKYIKGFITNLGGETAHTSIMARSLEIPAIVGTGNITQKIKDGDFIILDGINNQILINPKKNIIDTFKVYQKKYLNKKKKLKKFINLSATTIDQYTVEISANVSNIQDIINAKKYGTQSIGLYRTEFLFMGRTELPSEEEQFHEYKKAAIIMKNQPVIIRTMDIGGDKEIPYMKFPKEENPFLGWRAIRIGLDKKDILRTQLKAIIRASQFGKLRILFPMIISVEEIQELKYEIKKIQYILNKKKILFDKNIKIGIMIETPASAIIAKYLIQEVDFFSIGTNDLTQYTLAVDRRNDLISHLYNPMHPSVLKLIQKVIHASHAVGKWTGMCGELAGNEKAAILLLGMGLNEFSMNASCIPKIKKIIRQTTLKKAKELSCTILKKNTTQEIMHIINNFVL
ncbi:phosphoenolpyruvate-protein phosphotransferase PtsI [Buchnera aphidicola]|uniref:Phosphoenolpyruvate-protein phosphotransferase n=1 Tax=Buchnera aphidicola (Sarucallis kahawaluokalani) TaxID=1241878 RepID=A0A4D6YLM6_9GAMM|nr:phosphoenolpyruvate-protein phosphotransferase PtsI [Buchnera aphidicola]QCI25855.1 phosphoenolpyruvate-protein phosphotransferase PtsI [Buchnera aphidicola (Sarucallis kahawaluokalani)]